jgi:alkylation response protein AidB-like acyl-CoA dehydrogenase
VEHPAVAAARDLAERLLRPEAERVDVEGVPRSHLDALAAAGLMDLTDVPPPTAREVAELLAAADASTWFVWTQHHSPVRTASRGSEQVRERWLPRLTSGEVLSGVAFTHLRRPGRPALAARRRGDGWVVDGEVAWLTSWALADVFLLGAQADDDVVWALVALGDRPEVSAAPLALAAMSGTSTVRVRVDGLAVGADDVVLVEPLADWRAADAARSADVSAAVFGVTVEAVRRLRERDDPTASALADAVQPKVDALRASAYALMDDAGPGTRVEERLRLRAEAQLLACHATAGLVCAGAGRSMLLDAAAQRLARVALFLLVQGQTTPARDATLRAMTQVLLSSSDASAGAAG